MSFYINSYWCFVALITFKSRIFFYFFILFYGCKQYFSTSLISLRVTQYKTIVYIFF